MKSFKYLLALILSLLFSFDSAFCQWTDLNPWNTAKITGIEIVDSTYFVATENGIWRSQDSMQTWQRINQGLPKLKISKLFANVKVAIATIDGIGVFLSKDKGNTWTKSDFKHNNLSFVDIDNDSNLIYIATYNSLYSSSDNGETWSDTLFTSWFYDIKCIGSDIYCGTDRKGIYYSSNQGKNWEQRNVGIKDNFNIKSIDGNSDLMLMVTEYGINSDIYLSTNKGISWKRLNKDYWDEKLFTKPISTAIVIDSILYVRESVVGGTIYKSSNLGKDWEYAQSTGKNNEFEYKKHNGKLYMTMIDNAQNINMIGKQIAYQLEKNNFGNMGFPLIAPQSKYISSLHNSGNNLLIGSDKGISYSKKSGLDLTQNYFSYYSGYIYRIIFANIGSEVFAINTKYENTPTFLYSQNYGETWDSTNFDFTGSHIQAIQKVNDTIFAIGVWGYAYSTNNGKDWSQTILQNIQNNFLNAKDDKWYFQIRKDTNSYLAVSYDRGKTSTILTNMPNVYDFSTKLIFGDNGIFLKLYTQEFKYIDNNTKQVISLNRNLPAKDTCSILDIYTHNGILYCLIENRKSRARNLYYLIDMNSQWQEFTNKENALLGSKLYADDKYLYSFDPRFYRTELSNFKSMSVEIDTQSENPVVISLAQDILSFNLAIDEISSIEICNSLGKTIYSQSGIESIDVSNFTNGVYFAKIKTNGKTVVNKFVKY